jgi:hypothetical protein
MNLRLSTHLGRENRLRAGRAGGRLLSGFWLVLALRFLPQPAPAQLPNVVSYTNSAPISIPGPEYSEANPYPAVISVPPIPGILQKVTATLAGVSYAQPQYLEILLAGPDAGGQAVDLMFNNGGSVPVTDLNITFDDAGAALPTAPGTPLTSGPYQPSGTDFGDNPSATTNKLAGFIGTVLQGDWSLYVYDYGYNGNGAISNGWSLTFYYFPIQFSSPQTNSLGQFQATLSGESGVPLVIETSTDLIKWTPIATNAMAASSVLFTDTNSPAANLFYRAATSP